MRKLPIGIQSFEDIRRNGYLYVDKTEYIWKLAFAGKSYFLSRPRRFGKSLLVSAMEAYFRGRKELFCGLAAERLREQNGEPWTEYPVIRFSLSGGAYSEPDGLPDQLSNVLRKSAREYGIPDGSITGQTLPVRFRNLISALHESAGQPVVVLVDEYDKPLLANAADNPEMEEKNREIFQSFFSILKDADDDLKFVFITGVTKFSKTSIFSDLNQMRDISLLPAYSAICGITETELTDNFAPEIDAMAEAQGMSEAETKAELARMYDGYHFSKNMEGIYNPFSILNALSDQEFGSYWFETGTPKFLYKKLMQSGRPVQEFTDGVSATEARISNYRADDEDLVPLYYQSGYLTITGYDRRFHSFTLSYPNDEVKYGYLESLIPMVSPRYSAPDGAFSAEKMTGYLSEGDAQSFMVMLQALLAGIPYHEGKAPDNEQEWRNVIYAVFTVLGQYVHAEVHSAGGRSDCIVENEKYVYIFEFKKGKTAEEALQQIDQRGYARPYGADARTVIKIGASFSEEQRTLGEWRISADK